jgi:protein MpaA
MLSMMKMKLSLSRVFRRSKRSARAAMYASAAASLFLLSACDRPMLLPDLHMAGSDQIGESVQKRPLELLRLGSGPNIALVVATIHGREPAGTALLHEFAHYLRQHPPVLEGHTVALVAVANPDGYAMRRRTNAHGVDLNRNFPARNRQDTARYGMGDDMEPESAALLEVIGRLQPDRIISIHQPKACLDYDGPAEKIAESMASRCDLPIKKIGSRPGSLGSYAGLDLGIPVVTMELRRGDEKLTSHDIWSRYGNALIAGALYPNEPVMMSRTNMTVESTTAAVLAQVAALLLIFACFLVWQASHHHRYRSRRETDSNAGP